MHCQLTDFKKGDFIIKKFTKIGVCLVHHNLNIYYEQKNGLIQDEADLRQNCLTIIVYVKIRMILLIVHYS